MNLSLTRSTLLLGHHRDENRLTRAVIEINELLYEDEKNAKDRVELNTVRKENGEISCYELTGCPIDFFQIGLKYGKSEERDRIKYML
jgi:hypothetical protein